MNKPSYQVPTMVEIDAMPWNGYNVVSTFSGCGGSCLGFKMAGYRVLWASEFITAAQETYRANHPATLLDTRDIRTVDPAEILDAIGLRPGELDVFEGSPPCSAFSTAGKREAGWGEAKTYSDGAVQVVDDLFFEYARLLEALQPRVFVAENVSGLVKGTAKGYFKQILARLADCGYRVEARLLDAQWLGVPQTRQRLIFVGTRTDLATAPVFPRPFPYRYTVSDALPASTGYRTRRGIEASDKPAPTVLTHGRPFTQSEFTVISNDDRVWADDGYAYDPETGARIDIADTALAPEFDRAVAGLSHRFFQLAPASPDAPVQTVTAIGGGRGTAGVTHFEPRKFTLAELRRLCGFPDDFVLTGTYGQRWERLGRSVPPVMMRQVAETIATEILDPLRKEHEQ